MAETNPSHRSSHDPEDQGNRSPREAHRARRVGRSVLGQAAGSPSKGSERTSPERAHVYDKITNRIIQALEAGTVPWQRPWGASHSWPRSMATGKRYQGANVLMLGDIPRTFL